MTIHWKAVEQYFTVVLFVFQFYPVCNLRNFIDFGIGTVRFQRVKTWLSCYAYQECNYLHSVDKWSHCCLPGSKVLLSIYTKGHSRALVPTALWSCDFQVCVDLHAGKCPKYMVCTILKRSWILAVILTSPWIWLGPWKVLSFFIRFWKLKSVKFNALSELYNISDKLNDFAKENWSTNYF